MTMENHSIGLKRWAAKKIARAGVAAASLPLLGIARHRERLRVLTYHRFAVEARSPFSVAPAVLERQMAWLARSRLAVSAATAASVSSGWTPDRASVAVTVDDGDPTVLDAAPVFERHGIPYTLYVIPGRIGRRDHLTRSHLRDLVARGADIGSHTMTHRSVTGLAAHEMVQELEGSRRRIEDIIGRAVTSFAYPFGTLRDFDGRAADALRRAGYDFAFTSQHGAVCAGQDAMMLPRIKIEGGDPDRLFRAACLGALDQWRLIDARLAGLQMPEAKDRLPEPGSVLV